MTSKLCCKRCCALKILTLFCSFTKIINCSASDNMSRANPLDIDSSSFDCDAYVAASLKECQLDELLDKELSMYRDVRALECDMEQLVC